MRMLQHARCHLDLAAELAGQWPFGVLAIAEDAAEHARAGGHAGDLLDLSFAIDRKKGDALVESLGDVTLLLDGVAEGNAIRRGTCSQHHFDLANRGTIEAGAELRQHFEDLRIGVGLHGVENARVGQSLGEGQVIVAHNRLVDHEDRAIFTAGAQEIADTVGHRFIPQDGCQEIILGPLQSEPSGCFAV